MTIATTISMIVAIDEADGISCSTGLPWPRIAADMAIFRSVTAGKTIVMGHKTWLTLKAPLEGRRNLVWCSSARHLSPGAEAVTGNTDDILAHCAGDDIVVIGGAAVYTQFEPLATRLHITYVRGHYAADVHWSPSPAWDQTLAYRDLHDTTGKRVAGYMLLGRSTSMEIAQ